MKKRKDEKIVIGSFVVDGCGRVCVVVGQVDGWVQLQSSTGYRFASNTSMATVRLATKKESAEFGINLNKRPTSVEDVKRGNRRPFYDLISDEPKSVKRYHTNDTRFSMR